MVVVAVVVGAGVVVEAVVLGVVLGLGVVFTTFLAA